MAAAPPAQPWREGRLGHLPDIGVLSPIVRELGWVYSLLVAPILGVQLLNWCTHTRQTGPLRLLSADTVSLRLLFTVWLLWGKASSMLGNHSVSEKSRAPPLQTPFPLLGCTRCTHQSPSSSLSVSVPLFQEPPLLSPRFSHTGFLWDPSSPRGC